MRIKSDVRNKHQRDTDRTVLELELTGRQSDRGTERQSFSFFLLSLVFAHSLSLYPLKTKDSPLNRTYTLFFPNSVSHDPEDRATGRNALATNFFFLFIPILSVVVASHSLHTKTKRHTQEALVVLSRVKTKNRSGQVTEAGVVKRCVVEQW